MSIVIGSQMPVPSRLSWMFMHKASVCIIVMFFSLSLMFVVPTRLHNIVAQLKYFAQQLQKNTMNKTSMLICTLCSLFLLGCTGPSPSSPKLLDDQYSTSSGVTLVSYRHRGRRHHHRHLLSSVSKLAKPSSCAFCILSRESLLSSVSFQCTHTQHCVTQVIYFVC